jgi:hypothetical protein
LWRSAWRASQSSSFPSVTSLFCFRPEGRVGGSEDHLTFLFRPLYHHFRQSFIWTLATCKAFSWLTRHSFGRVLSELNASRRDAQASGTFSKGMEVASALTTLAFSNIFGIAEMWVYSIKEWTGCLLPCHTQTRPNMQFGKYRDEYETR